MSNSRPTVRPLTHDAGAALDRVFAGLSPHSRLLRYHAPMPRLPGSVRRALLDLDGRDRLGFVAEVPTADGPLPVGLGRLVRTGPRTAELALEVVDDWQRRGVGRQLLAALHAAAEERGWTALEARVLPGNDRVGRMLRAAFPGTTACWDGDAVVLACPVGLPEIGPEDLLAALVS